ncbi:MAG: DNA alkylation repair protein [Chloroflexota bacterium]
MSYADEFRTFVKTAGELKPEGSTQSGSSKAHYLLRNPQMREFVKGWAREHPDLRYDEWESLMTELYAGETTDEVCLAGMMLGHYKPFRQQAPLDVLDSWIGQLEGWREIDTTCQSNYTAQELLAEWDSWDDFLLGLATRDTIQHRRASLVLLVKPVRDSADSRLIDTALANVERLKGETDILITKAISWVLREAVKRHREAVGAYVEANAESLPAIAVREFKKKFETGKKT